jgi:hypothetical protein
MLTTTHEDDRGDTKVKHHAKAVSSEPTRGRPGRLAQIFGAFATRGASREADGSGTSAARPVTRHRLMILAVLVVLSTVLALAGGTTQAFAAEAPSEITELKVNEEERVNEEHAKLQLHATRATVCGHVEVEGYETNMRLEYAANSENGPWTLAEKKTAPSGEYALTGICVDISHLTPETKYYVRLSIEGAFGAAAKTIHFTTLAIEAPDFEECPGNYPFVFGPGTYGFEYFCGGEAPRITSFNIRAHIHTNGAETKYHFEYATSKEGPYTPVPGASGSITVAEDDAVIPIHVEGLAAKTTYYIRGVAANEKGTVTMATEITTASASPLAFGAEIGSVTGTSVHLKGQVNPATYETHWRFEYATSVSGPWTLAPGASGTIATAEAGETDQTVEADLVGLSPSTTYYVRLFAENVNGSSTSTSAGFETGGPPLVETFATHAIHGEALRVLGAVTPDGFDTHYYFQYVSQGQFEEQGGEGGFAKAESTPEVDAGPGERTQLLSEEYGFPTTVVGEDIPGLEPGRTYRFRIVATNVAPGDPVVQGETQTLTVPAGEPSGVAQASACPNLRFRTGLSAQLPDCRAFEQITPAEKEGALEPFNTLNAGANAGDLIGEDGDHFMIEASATDWGSGQGPYFFSRTPAGWQMTAATPPSEAGISHYEPGAFSPNLTSFSLEASWEVASEVQSPDDEVKVGSPGGPYATVVSAPRSSDTKWVAASEGMENLVLESEDRTLVPGHPSATTSGDDLYEYAEGQLRQTNVLTGGATIGSCGATVPSGAAERRRGGGSLETIPPGSRRAVSADGSRVFFEAEPGSSCGEPMHLYMRTGGVETLDIGEYTFLAANADGSELLLEKQSGEARELFLYETESRTAKRLFLLHNQATFMVSEDFNAIYFHSAERLTPEAPVGESLYRYEIPTETLRFVLSSDFVKEGNFVQTVSPDGRYDYFRAGEVLGLPGGARAAELYRYDSVEDSVECVSCASPFDPEPRHEVDNTASATGVTSSAPVASANGDYAFFETTSALVPQDLDGEIPQGNPATEGRSPSWDIYEWRGDGVYGCAHVQGCVSLITPGTDGVLVALIGTTASGEDLFFTTHSQLVPQDKDSSGDVYDARIGGGFPTAARPVECEGDACSTPASPPIDATPSSFTFTGAGNLVVPPPALMKAKAKGKAKRKAAVCHKGRRCVKRKTKRAKKSAAKSHRRGGK